MNRLALSAAAAAFCLLVSPAIAQQAPATSFDRDGITYFYTASQQGKSLVIEGENSDGSEYRLVVLNGRVDGYFDDRRVSFAVPRKAPRKEVAAR